MIVLLKLDRMQLGLIILGVIVLGVIFFVGNVYITPQQRNQIDLAGSGCESALGKIAGALSSGVAEDCQKIQLAKNVLSFEPFVYIAGAGLLVLGFLIPSGKKEVKIIREIVKPQIEPEDIEEKIPKHTKKTSKFCGNCGTKVSTNSKFCSDCGEKI